ncbi:MAG: response regulator transcription factor [Clostridia bacterium]
MYMKKKILVIDDDMNICQLLKIYLEKEGYNASVAYDGMTGMKKFWEEAPDLVILDIMLPVMDGWEICRKIKREKDVPVLMLSAKGETYDKVLGLELGADDYLVKPFDPKELMARIKAILRRSGKGESLEKIELPGLVVNKSTYTVILKDKIIDMPPKELELLYFFVSNPNVVFTRDNLLEKVWGFDFFGDSRTVDVHVKRLREKIENSQAPWQLKTVWGVGYKFEVNQ